MALSPKATRQFIIIFYIVIFIVGGSAVYMITAGRNNPALQDKLEAIREYTLPPELLTENAPEADYKAAILNVRTELESVADSLDWRALSVSIVRDRRLVWGLGLGSVTPAGKNLVTPASSFRAGDLGEWIIRIALLRAVDENLISLADPVGKFIKGTNLADSIMINDLLAHTSGLPLFDNLSQVSLKAAVNEIPDYTPADSASNTESALLVAGRLLEILYNDDFPTVIQRNVMRQMELDYMSFKPILRVARFLVRSTPDELPHPEPAGMPSEGFLSSTNDLARITSMLFAGGLAPNGRRILSEDQIAKFWAYESINEPVSMISEMAGATVLVQSWPAEKTAIIIAVPYINVEEVLNQFAAYAREQVTAVL